MDEFNKTHLELKKHFIKIYINDSYFFEHWQKFQSKLLFNNSDIDPSFRNISQATKDNYLALWVKFNNCTEYILADKTIVKLPEKHFRQFLLGYLNSIATTLINDPDTDDFTLSRIIDYWLLHDNHFKEYKEYIYAKEKIIKIKALLRNFDKEDNHPIDISEDVKLERDLQIFRPTDLCVLTFVIREEKFPIVNGSIIGTSEKTLGDKIVSQLIDVLSALRLLKSGEVGISQISYLEPLAFGEWQFLEVLPELMVWDLAKEKYQLKNSDLPELIKKIEQVQNIPSWLEVPLSRLNKSYTRHDIADQILDLAIAMEAITQSSDNSSTYKISTNLTLLLGQDTISKKNNSEKIKSFYGLRSSIVHDGVQISKQLRKEKYKRFFNNENDVLDFGREMVKGSINIFLSQKYQSKKKDEIWKEVLFGRDSGSTPE